MITSSYAPFQIRIGLVIFVILITTAAQSATLAALVLLLHPNLFLVLNLRLRLHLGHGRSALEQELGVPTTENFVQTIESNASLAASVLGQLVPGPSFLVRIADDTLAEAVVADFQLYHLHQAWHQLERHADEVTHVVQVFVQLPGQDNLVSDCLTFVIERVDLTNGLALTRSYIDTGKLDLARMIRVGYSLEAGCVEESLTYDRRAATENYRPSLPCIPRCLATLLNLQTGVADI